MRRPREYDKFYGLIRRCPQCRSDDTKVKRGCRVDEHGDLYRNVLCRSCGCTFREILLEPEAEHFLLADEFSE